MYNKNKHVSNYWIILISQWETYKQSGAEAELFPEN